MAAHARSPGTTAPRRTPTDDISTDDTSAERFSVAIVDDHPPIREAVCREVEQAIGMTVATEAGSPEEAARLVGKCGPDVAVLDLCFGEGQGFGLIETLRAECPGMDLLVFSVYEETVYAERALRAGASGYLMKDAPMEELRAALRRVAEGEVYLSPKMTARVFRLMQGGDGELCFPIDELTGRELRVFQMLGRGLGMDAIADRLGLARKTIETYRRRAKEKLGYETIDEVVSHAARWTQAGEDVETRTWRRGRRDEAGKTYAAPSQKAVSG